jgi:glycosyltransferase involved in cell wall biosynthesis
LLRFAARNPGVEVYIVSSLNISDYTDHTAPDRYAADLKLLDLPNVRHYDSLPNDAVLELMRACDYHVRATVADTYGFSTLEAGSVGTPTIATATCAIPEVVPADQLLTVPVNEVGDIVWLRPTSERDYRSTDAYWQCLDEFFDDMAEQIEARLETVDYAKASEQAVQRIRDHHYPQAASAVLDAIYLAAIHGKGPSAAH